MNKIVSFLFICLLLADLHAQNTIKIIDKDKTSTPVSPYLWGSFFEMGFGRSDLLWGELLFNRSFENTKPVSESNSWYTCYRGDVKEAKWWHSGYEEPKWYLLADGRKEEKLPLIFNNYWPSAHGKYFLQIDNRKKQTPTLLVQERIYIEKGKGYTVSGLFSSGGYLSEEKYSKESVPVTIAIYKEGDFHTPLSKTELAVNTNQFILYSSLLDATEYEGWCTYTVEVPAGGCVGIDLLSLMADDVIKGWKRESVERIKNELRPRTMRMPGGCFTSLYDWRSGIGPREERPVSYDTWWGCELLNDVGTFELVDLCEAVGAEPFFCVPVMFNNEYSAADWVDFCNNPTNAQRIAYGRTKPLNVKYWELENEPYRRFDAVTYANRCVDFAKAMKAKDPSIKIAVGNYWLFNKKFKEMLEIVGPYVDLITNRGGTPEEMRADIVILDAYNKAHGTDIKLCHTEFRAPVTRNEGNTDGLNQKDTGGEETLFNASIRWGFAMNMVEQYIAYQNMGGSFFTANYTNLSDGWGECLINTPKEGTYLNTPGVAFALLNSLDIAYPQIIEQEKENQDIVIQAAWNKRRDKLTLVVLNFSQNTQPCKIDFSQIKKSFRVRKGMKIAPQSDLSFNTLQHPEEVKVESFVPSTGKMMKLGLPGNSLIVVELQAERSHGIHVNASTGNDASIGSLAYPLKTIQAAADMAEPGDTVIVHEGIYRERVSPSRGGESEEKPIVFMAAKGENVEIKGSEVMKGWKKVNDTTWEVGIPNKFFGGFNPYAETLHGDWFERGKWCHTGEIYLNDIALMENPSLSNVLQNKGDSLLWFCKVEQDTTRLYANFGDKNPNQELVEINVRQSVFYPERPYVNYIVVNGFKLSQAATPWAPPTAEQIGLLGTHWSKGWVIENNTITHSKCVGITLGKYGDEWDNKSESEEGYVNCVKRALRHNWNREHIGGHLVRNNTVAYCGQAGIAGSLGAIFSKIKNNTVHDISTQNLFWGYEMAGIKIHAAVDVEISGNHIYRVEGGIWLDWMAQGARVTRNLLHDNRVVEVSFEVNHGPILVDNNLFLSPELAQIKLSQGMAFVHNLIVWKVWKLNNVDPRKTPYLAPHGTEIMGYHDCPCGNVSYFNNIFTRAEMTEYDDCVLPVQMEKNCYWGEAVSSGLDKNATVNSGFDADIQVIEKTDGWYLQINVPENWKDEKFRDKVSTKDLGRASIPDQSFNKENGTVIDLIEDYWGQNRKGQKKYYPGPIDFTTNGGKVMLKVYDK